MVADMQRQLQNLPIVHVDVIVGGSRDIYGGGLGRLIATNQLETVLNGIFSFVGAVVQAEIAELEDSPDKQEYHDVAMERRADLFRLFGVQEPQPERADDGVSTKPESTGSTDRP